MRRSFLWLPLLALDGALALFNIACSGTHPSSNSSPSSPMNMAGNWTLTVTSTQGQGTVSATGDVAQSGQGIGVNGMTTLSGVVGSITVSQSGDNLTGTISNATKGASYNYTGTLSGNTITISGSVACGVGKQSISITGTISSTEMHGNYTVTRDSSCYYASDAGAWSGTKQ